MSEPFVGEIRQVGFNFAPRGWALCQGQLLPVAGNDALFSLLGTIYGGDGRTTFGLPDLRGRVALHQGTGPGLTQRQIGQKSGTETVTLTQNQMPSHGHTLQASTDVATSATPAAGVVGQPTTMDLYVEDAPTVDAASAMIQNTGGSGQHNNEMPRLTVNWAIALQGIYPSRS